MAIFQNASYYISAHHLTDLPAPTGIEIAFAGRSNAGKSSAINTLANHNRLAFVSKQPGRTQLINFFSLGGNRFLVDLPGYGYAKVPHAIKDHWQKTLATYLSERSCLFGLVLVMDIRHPLMPLDQQMIAWFSLNKKPIHILLTKADKLSREASLKTLHAVEKEINEKWGDTLGISCTVQLFSSLKRKGVDEAEIIIGKWLKTPVDHVPNLVT
jgi:GTP-binding protein